MQIRITTYKSLRHYGGRDITPTAHTVEAEFICVLPDGSTLVVLLQDGAGFKKGHKIAVLTKDIIKG